MKKYHVVLLAALFSSGILASSNFNLPFIALYFYWGVLLFSLLILYIYRVKLAKLLVSYIIHAGIFLTGMLSYSSPEPFEYCEELHKEKVSFYGTVTSISISSNEQFRFTAESDSFIFKGQSFYYKGKFNCVLSFQSDLYPGNKLLLHGIFIKGRNIRNPGEFDFEGYLLKNGIKGFIYSYNKDNLIIQDSDRDFIPTFIHSTRKSISDRVLKYFNYETAGLVNGLLLGERGDIDQEVKTGFINSGTAHVLAVSGLNVGYVVLIFLIFFGRFNLYFRSILTITGIIIYAFISGGSPSILRASLMAIIIIVAYVSNRSTNIVNSLALSAFLILIIDPGEIFLPGFQLSYAAVLSSALIYPIFKDHIKQTKLKNGMIKKVLLISAVSIAAQIGTMPFVLFYFSKLSLTSILANLVIIPLIGFILGAGFITLLISIFSSYLACLFASSTDLMNLLLIDFVKIMGEPSFSFLWINNFSLLDSLIYYAVIILFFVFINKTKNLISKIFLFICTSFIIIIYTSLDDEDFLKNNLFNCYMIDIGQGDAFLIKFPSGQTALIDAGQTTARFDTGERIIEPLLNYCGINQIDFAFISHLDTDHYSGFVYLILKGYVKTLYKPPPDTSRKSLRFEKFLKNSNVHYEYYNNKIINTEEARIYILDNSGFQQKNRSDNDQGGVFLIAYGKTTFLFTGDAGTQAEEYYAEKYGEFLKTDVLKVSHHGSASGTSGKFLYISRPAVSLISAGEKNKYGHPSGEVLKRLELSGSKIYRTDKEGGILIQSDGHNIKKINWK